MVNLAPPLPPKHIYSSESLILRLYNKTDDSFVENARTTEWTSKFSVRVNGGRLEAV